jgi:PIN domain nuclease of toxin-antitoxin system
MKLLWDTHTFIWFVSGSQILPSELLETLENNDENFISIVSLWELATKSSLGKLTLHVPFDEILLDIENNGLKILNISFSQLIGYTQLPFHHRDPFDRLIIAQAKTENMKIVGKDTAFDSYGIDRIW